MREDYYDRMKHTARYLLLEQKITTELLALEHR
jgi:hypothetical protein